VELARRALLARTCVLLVREVDPPGWTVVSAASSAPDFDAKATIPLGHGLVTWAARRDEPLALVAPSPQLRLVPWHAGDSTAGSFLAVGVHGWHPAGVQADAEGAAWAVMACDRGEADAYGAADAETLEAFGREVLAGLEAEEAVAAAGLAAAALAALPEAVLRVGRSPDAAEAAATLLGEACRITGAEAGAVLLVGRTGPRRPRPRLAAAQGLEVDAGHALEAGDESWALWSIRHPEGPVRLPAFAADRGMSRICRGDGLDSSWSFASWALGGAGAEAPGALALAWPSRVLPAPSLLDAASVLAASCGPGLVGPVEGVRGAGRPDLDGATGLPGRTACLVRGLALAQGAGARSPAAVLVVDLDGSRSLRRERGPAAVDEALAAVARVLGATLPQGVELFRWGSDEIVALFGEGSDETVLVASRRSIAASCRAQLEAGSVSVSGGIARARPGEALEAVVERALQAAAAAHAKGGGQVCASLDVT
jgi:GGDEF domain-containing protein